MGQSTEARAATGEGSIVDRVLELLWAYMPELDLGVTTSPRSRPARARAVHETKARPTTRRSDGRGRKKSKKTARANRRRKAKNKSVPKVQVDPVLALHYSVLETAYGADLKRVKSAWRKMVLKHHPDRNIDESETEAPKAQRIVRINRAYEHLLRHLKAKH